MQNRNKAVNARSQPSVSAESIDAKSEKLRNLACGLATETNSLWVKQPQIGGGSTCTAQMSYTQAQRESGLSLRFGTGTRVECSMDAPGMTAACWAPGTITRLWCREEGWPLGKLAPYAVQLDHGAMIFVPIDGNKAIRPLVDAGAELDPAAAATAVRVADGMARAAAARTGALGDTPLSPEDIAAEAQPQAPAPVPAAAVADPDPDPLHKQGRGGGEVEGVSQRPPSSERRRRRRRRPVATRSAMHSKRAAAAAAERQGSATHAHHTLVVELLREQAAVQRAALDLALATHNEVLFGRPDAALLKGGGAGAGAARSSSSSGGSAHHRRRRLSRHRHTTSQRRHAEEQHGGARPEEREGGRKEEEEEEEEGEEEEEEDRWSAAQASEIRVALLPQHEVRRRLQFLYWHKHPGRVSRLPRLLRKYLLRVMTQWPSQSELLG
jgi:hypothetical protein